MQYIWAILSCDRKYGGYLHSKNRILVIGARKRKEMKRKEIESGKIVGKKGEVNKLWC
jgi:hypothetical protein